MIRTLCHVSYRSGVTTLRTAIHLLLTDERPSVTAMADTI